METVTECDPTSKSTIATAMSWIALVVALACLGYVGFYIPAERAHFMRMFNDFEVQLPTATVLMLSIPNAAFFAYAIVFALVALAIQWFARSKYVAVLCHAIVIMLCGFILLAYRETIFYPLSSLVQSLS